MATLDTATALILPRPDAGRRNSVRRRPQAVPSSGRGAAARRRMARPETSVWSGERVDTAILQGLILVAMGGMLAWFHAPLAAAVRAIF